MVAAVEVRATQAFSLTAVTAEAAGIRNTQLLGLVSAKGPAALRTTQAFCLVAIKTGAEERELRGWTFTQDDHDFCVFQLGSATLVWDKLTGQWCQWQSPGATVWNGQDGCDWEGFNVCCDPATGDIWKIDPENRLDNNTTPIVSQVFAFVTTRLRKIVPVYLAEVAISEGKPPAGIDPTTVGIKLRTSDTVNGFVDHGTVAGVASGSMLYSRWYGLGVAQYPGILVEITDSGYARRIDGLTVELGAAADQGG